MTNENYKDIKKYKGIPIHSNYRKIEIPLKSTFKSTTTKTSAWESAKSDCFS